MKATQVEEEFLNSEEALSLLTTLCQDSYLGKRRSSQDALYTQEPKRQVLPMLPMQALKPRLLEVPDLLIGSFEFDRHSLPAKQKSVTIRKRSRNQPNVGVKQLSQVARDRSLRGILGAETLRTDSLESYRTQEKLLQFSRISDIQLTGVGPYQSSSHFLMHDNLQKAKLTDASVDSQRHLRPPSDIYDSIFAEIRNSRESHHHEPSIRSRESTPEERLPYHVRQVKVGRSVYANTSQSPRQQQRQRSTTDIIQRNKRVRPKPRKIYCQDKSLDRSNIDRASRERFVSQVLKVRGGTPELQKEKQRQIHMLGLVETFEHNPAILINETVVDDPRVDEFKRLKEVERQTKRKYQARIAKLKAQLEAVADEAERQYLKDDLDQLLRGILKEQKAEDEKFQLEVEEVLGIHYEPPTEEEKCDKLRGIKQALHQYLSKPGFMTQFEKQRKREYWARIKRQALTKLQEKEKSSVKGSEYTFQPEVFSSARGSVPGQSTRRLESVDPTQQKINETIARTLKFVRDRKPNSVKSRLFDFRQALLEELNLLQAEQLQYEDSQNLKELEKLDHSIFRERLLAKFEQRVKEAFANTEVFQEFEGSHERARREQLKEAAGKFVSEVKQTIQNHASHKTHTSILKSHRGINRMGTCPAFQDDPNRPERPDRETIPKNGDLMLQQALDAEDFDKSQFNQESASIEDMPSSLVEQLDGATHTFQQMDTSEALTSYPSVKGPAETTTFQFRKIKKLKQIQDTTGSFDKRLGLEQVRLGNGEAEVKVEKEALKDLIRRQQQGRAFGFKHADRVVFREVGDAVDLNPAQTLDGIFTKLQPDKPSAPVQNTSIGRKGTIKSRVLPSSSETAIKDKDEERKLSKAKAVKQEIVKSVIVDDVLKNLSVPLPLVDKIRHKTLVLNNYSIGAENFKAFVSKLEYMVPQQFTRLVLVDNNLPDHAISALFKKLKTQPGLKELVIDQNCFGTVAVSELAEFIQSESFSTLQTFAVKQPILKREVKFTPMLGSFEVGSRTLQKLSLQSLPMTKDDVCLLAKNLRKLINLKQLSLAGNSMTGDDLLSLFTEMHPKASNLTHLDLSWNSATCQTAKDQKKLDRLMQQFLHETTTLQHLDISGLQISEQSLMALALKGIRKSKTLLVVHVAGIMKASGTVKKMREWLKVEIDQAKVEYSAKPHLQCRSQFPHDRQSLLLDKEANRKHVKAKESANQAFCSKAFQASVHDRVIFQRFLGHLEIVNGHRWREATEETCFICNQWAYTVVLWDAKLATESGLFNHVARPLLGNIQSKFASVLCSVEALKEVHPMLPIKDFVSRLQANQANHYDRKIQDVEEQKRLKEVVQKVLGYCQKKSERSVEDPENECPSRLNWSQHLRRYLLHRSKPPQGPLSSHGLPSLFQCGAQDTSLYLLACYLPPGTSSIVTQPIFSSKSSQASQHLTVTIKPDRDVRRGRKLTKKISELRHFSKEMSVFGQYFVDDNDYRRRQLDYDRDQSKVFRLSKDKREIDRVHDVLFEYFLPIRDQFFFAASDPSVYPVIKREQLHKLITLWQAKDESLLVADIDRQFIATNVELQNNEVNDDLGLCRYEFFEIIVRLAKTKFCDRGPMLGLAEATRMFCEEYVIPNNPVPFLDDSNDWRARYLFTIEVDDILRLNMDPINACFNFAKQPGSTMVKVNAFLSLENTLQFFQQIKDFPGTQAQISLAYALSKMQFIEEQDQTIVKQYNQMRLTEWLEFLGRLAWLIWDDPLEPMERKYFKILSVMFPVVGAQVTEADGQDDQESESDYDDDVAMQVVKRHYPRELYAGFGKVKYDS